MKKRLDATEADSAGEPHRGTQAQQGAHPSGVFPHGKVDVVEKGASPLTLELTGTVLGDGLSVRYGEE